ncbi:MAG: hypothetical protein GX796_00940 [Clostridiaceae bacterium]|nr:hypothetical protein [Clostridiaceae bacterium]
MSDYRTCPKCGGNRLDLEIAYNFYDVYDTDIFLFCWDCEYDRPINKVFFARTFS